MGPFRTVNWLPPFPGLRESLRVEIHQPLAIVQELQEDWPNLGVLLVGHGTRSKSGQQQLRVVFHDFESLLAPLPCELGFLELAEPSISKAVEQLTRRGAQRIVVVPVLLFSAGHAETDIPQAVEAAVVQFGASVVCQTSPLGLAPALLELSAIRFREAACTVPEGCETQTDCGSGRTGCCGQVCGRSGLVMVGRGSNSDSATDAMREFLRRRLELTPLLWHSLGFIHAQSPSVEDALAALASSKCGTVIVQPHLLFEGQLSEDLRHRVAQLRLEFPEKRWVMVEPLGVDERLPRLLADSVVHDLKAQSLSRN